MSPLHRPEAVVGTTGAVVPARRPRRGVEDLAITASRVAVLVAAGVSLVVPGWVLAHETWILAAGFLLGLPHGALDHLLPFRHGWVRRGPVGLLGVLLGYVGLAGLAYAGLRLAGGLVLPVLLTISVLHFGAADLEPTSVRPMRRGTWPWAARVLAAVGRGGPVVAGPLLAWPAATGTALGAVGIGFDPATTAGTVAALVLLGASTGYAVVSVTNGRLPDAGEVLLLVALFTAVPPLAAFGIYFGAWHGLRHTARLLADDPRNVADLAAGHLAAPLRRFAVGAAVPTALALATVVVLVRLAAGQAALVGPVFDILLALTVPHVLVVALWEARRDRSST